MKESLRIIKQGFKYLPKWPKYAAVQSVFAVFDILATLIFTQGMAYAVGIATNPSQKTSYRMIALIFAAVFALMFADQAFMTLSNLGLTKVSMKTSAKIRTAILDKLTRLKCFYFEKWQKGDLQTRITDDYNNAEYVYSSFIIDSILGIIQNLVFTVYCFIISWQLSLAVFLLVPLFTMFLSKLSAQIEDRMVKQRKSSSDFMNVLIEGLSGFQVLQSFGALRWLGSNLKEQSENIRKYEHQLAGQQQLIWLIEGLSGIISDITMYVFGPYLIFTHQLSIAGWTAFYYARYNASGLLYIIRDSLITIRQNGVNIRRVLEPLQGPLDTESETNPVAPQDEPIIKLGGITFSYNKENKILDSITKDVYQGRKIGIVGHTGSGKSTLLKIIAGFYEPSGGKVKLMGLSSEKDLGDTWYRQVSYVDQTSVLFTGSMRENILCGLNNSDKEANIESEVKKVMTQAHLADINEFPDGENTEVGQDGGNLSGGQRQRVSIARALIKQAPVLLLDEPTSALNPDLADKVIKGIVSDKNQTLLCVTHDLKECAYMDEIWVLQNGKLVETGNYDSLVKAKGVFYGLLQKEAKKSAHRHEEGGLIYA